MTVDIDQSHCWGQRDTQLATGKGNQPAARLIQQLEPARSLELVDRYRGWNGLAEVA